MDHIPSGHVVAMLNRAKRMLVGNALIGNQFAVTWAQASIKTLNSLLNGAAEGAAEFDASKGGHYVPASWQAAWASFPEGIENHSLVEVQQFLTAHGLQIATDVVAYGQVDGIVQGEGGVVTALNLHDEHSALAADLHDGAGLHSGSPCRAAILYMPQGAGKSAIALDLAQRLGCTQVVHEWCAGQPLTAGALHLTNVEMQEVAA